MPRLFTRQRRRLNASVTCPCADPATSSSSLLRISLGGSVAQRLWRAAQAQARSLHLLWLGARIEASREIVVSLSRLQAAPLERADQLSPRRATPPRRGHGAYSVERLAKECVFASAWVHSDSLIPRLRDNGVLRRQHFELKVRSRVGECLALTFVKRKKLYIHDKELKPRRRKTVY